MSLSSTALVALFLSQFCAVRGHWVLSLLLIGAAGYDCLGNKDLKSEFAAVILAFSTCLTIFHTLTRFL